MFYRVDYEVGLFLFGLVVALLSFKHLAGVASPKLERGYCAYLLAVGTRGVYSAFAIIVPDVHPSTPLRIALTLWGDLNLVVLGSLAGLGLGTALRLVGHEQLRALLRSGRVPMLVSGVIGLGFLFSGVAKLIYLSDMTQFFQQSGYSVAFLKSISLAEVLGGAALMFSPTTNVALPALTLLMFGALCTVAGSRTFHSSNRRLSQRPLVRIAVLAGGVLTCFVLALVGAAVERHRGS